MSKSICLLLTISALLTSNAAVLTGNKLKLTVNDTKGSSDTTVKIYWGSNRNAELIPLDSNYNGFKEVKFLKKFKNRLDVFYFSKTNGIVCYSYIIDPVTGYIRVSSSSLNTYVKLRLKTELIVIPDLITNDEVLYPDKSPGKVRIPGDNKYFIGLLAKGNAMFSCLWDSPRQYIVVNNSQKCFSDFICKCYPGNNIWFGFLAQDNIWYQHSGTLKAEFQQIDWNPPFTAMWHMSYRRAVENNIGDSWLLLLLGKINHPYKGIYLPDVKKMNGWIAGRGWINYPCYNQMNKTCLRIPLPSNDPNSKNEWKNVKPVIYPIEGLQGNKCNLVLPVDAVKKYLGELCWRKSKTNSSRRAVFPATCGITNNIEKVFYRDEVEKKAEYIRSSVMKMDNFVYVVNTQIMENIKFAEMMQKWLAEQKKTFPDLTEKADCFSKQLAQISKIYLDAKQKIQTPEDYMKLSRQLIALIDSKASSEDKENKCKELGRKIRIIGGAQDGVSGKQRMLFKAIKQKATLRLVECKNLQEAKLLEKLRGEINSILIERGLMGGK
jgi:hypothetical protein